MLITTISLQHGSDIYLLRYPPHLSLGGQDYITSSALDREGESRLWPLGAIDYWRNCRLAAANAGWCLLFIGVHS